ncbi:hypothetical protein KZO11_09970 [Streptomyces anulatus]|uniref:hypothetical protein n=1 Tax=Streptomyces anulatus TaxID=1892 RepID=UPI001C6018B0|nr:hypothetical protein [Streptomyces anulatus]QYA94013.1 hypothetical protein KZO11_09970 [Streptomyces anulatus]
MRIRMLVQMNGTRDGAPWPSQGEEADLPTAAAAHLVSAGVAEQVDETPPASLGKRRQGGRRGTVTNP